MKDNISAFRTTQMMITGAFEVYHYREPYFKSLNFHNHDFYEAYLFLDGGVTYYIEDRAYDLVPGDLLIIPPGRMHRPAILDSTAVYERIVLWLNVDYLRLLDDPENTLQTMLSRFDGKDGYRLSLQDDTLSFSLSILHRLISLSTDCSPSGRFEQRALISAFLANVCSAQENAEKTARDAKGSGAYSGGDPLYQRSFYRIAHARFDLRRILCQQISFDPQIQGVYKRYGV